MRRLATFALILMASSASAQIDFRSASGGGLTNLGTGVQTFLTTPSSANLMAALTDETGTGAAVFASTPTLITPVLGAATGTSLALGGALVGGSTITIPASGVIAAGILTATFVTSQKYVGIGDGTNTLLLGTDDGTTGFIGMTTAKGLAFRTNNTARLTIGATGGTVISDTLAIGGSLTANYSLDIASTSNTGRALVRTSDATSASLFEVNNSTGSSAYGLFEVFGGSNGATIFGTSTNHLMAIRAGGANISGLLIGTDTSDPLILGTGNGSRDYIFDGAKTLTAGAATNVVRVGLAQGSVAGGLFKYCVRASDATDYLVRCGDVEWAAVNKAGTETCTIGVVGGGDVCADTVTPGTCAISTLTAAFTCVSNSADTIDIQINAAAAITETTLNAGWRLQQNYGTGAVTPQ